MPGQSIALDGAIVATTNQARVRLTTHCLDDVLARRAGPSHLEAMLALGDSARADGLSA